MRRASASAAGRIAGVYVLVSLLWILLSDRAVGWITDDPGTAGLLQTVKGWGFVAASGLLVLLVSHHYVDRAAAREEEYRLLAEHATDAVVRLDAASRVSWASPSCEVLLGWRPEELVGRPGLDVVHPAHRGRAAHERDDMRPGERRSAPMCVLTAGGGTRWITATLWALQDAGGGWVVGLHDAEAQMGAELARRTSEAQYRLLAENATDVVLRCDATGRCGWASPSVTPLLGWDAEELLGREVASLVHSDDRAALEPAGTAGHRAMARFAVAGGGWRWTSAAARPLQGPDGRAAGMLLSVRDAEDEERARRRLAESARRDALTGLANRDEAVDRLGAALRDASPERPVGLLHVDVDDFAKVNDALTHEAGDRMLVEVAARVAAAAEAAGAEAAGVVARTGGDEFLVVLPRLADAADAAVVAERVRTAVREPLRLADRDLLPTVSIGVVTASRAQPAAQLVRDAELALRRAKDLGRDRWELLDAPSARSARGRLDTESRLRQALLDGQLRAWFQPLVRLEDRSVVGFECLVRWEHPERGVVPPGEFLPVAEAGDLVVALDRAVLGQAVHALADLPDDVHLAVNVSAASLRQPDAEQAVLGALRAADADPARLSLELTETALLRLTDPVRRTLDALARTGVSLYVDDFGTGYSSITHLRDLPVRGLKLDRSFTAGLGGPDDVPDRLSAGLVGLARGLRLRTVAEGVETEQQARTLLAQGWELGQGYLFGRPAPDPDLSSGAGRGVRVGAPGTARRAS